MISIILGTRPEIVKMSPIIRACEKQHEEYFILHTGQHYSYSMDKNFFEQLNLPDPKYNLDVGSNTQAVQTAKMMTGIEKILMKEKPDIVLVQGDTNSVLSGAIVASKLNIKVGHIEAGLRSYDRSMPEEINRILTDHCSDYLFPPTEKSKQILLKEGVSEDKIFVTGNTVVDAVYQNMKLPGHGILNDLALKDKEYFLVTAHRQENVDSISRFSGILEGINIISEEFNLPVVYPIHPRSRKMMETFGLNANENIKLVDPVDYLNFLRLEAGAKMIMTDSGGVQEEACILRTPCITMRDNTERPETIDVGSNMLAGTQPLKMLECVRQMYSAATTWINPFGDGNTGERIVSNICGRD